MLLNSQCCIVGGGPAGVVLAYLLVRQGVRVTLLEAAADFDREFRGDTLTPSVMEMLAELGLADRLLELPHSRIAKIVVQTEEGPLKVTDYSFLRSRFNYITVISQARFLSFMVDQMRSAPNFELVMGANVRELIEEGGAVRGVVYQHEGQRREHRSSLVVGADGRFSRLRHLSGLKLVKTSPPMDVLWFSLPRLESEPADLNLSVRIGRGYYTALTDRFTHWQVSLVIPKGSSKEFKARGDENLRQAVAQAVPAFADRVSGLDWSQVFVLSVQSSRLTRWYKPGLLLIGDAAHTMSSVGGVGINCAIQDAAVVSNVLGKRLRQGPVEVGALREVQWRREIPIRLLQFLQKVAQKQVIERALDPNKPFQMPLSLRIPWINRLAVWVAAYGVWPVKVDQSGFLPPLRAIQSSTLR
ncbi:MAG: FAD-dependent oxidoreductase [Candidatus Xenobia bacterium]